jgi:heme O synthase-like polyprenyltransferase
VVDLITYGASRQCCQSTTVHRLVTRSLARRASTGVLCGAAASGNFEWTPEDVAKSLLTMFMSGPLLTGYTQTINDYYDREIDAINEPYRPIPSGAPAALYLHVFARVAKKEVYRSWPLFWE